MMHTHRADAERGDSCGHSVREVRPDASPETATELLPRECCASMLPVPAALVIGEGGALGDAALDAGVWDAGAGALAAGVDTVCGGN